MAEIELSNVTKIYDMDVVGAEDITISVHDGEFIVLVGPSGCGKTTTLELVAGLQRPTRGDVKIGGQVVNDVKPQNRGIAMVFQNYALYPHKTVTENLIFGLKYTSSLSKTERTERANEIASMLDIEDLLDKKPGQLSGGQQQRVALGRAIARDPGVFLLDEPLSNLDAKLRTQMRAELQQLQNELNVTTVYVTHDQTEAMTMGDRIVVMDQGELQQVGTPSEVYNKPANEFVGRFIGSPSMNLLDGELRGTTVETQWFSYTVDGWESDYQGAIQFGVRPEDIQIVDDRTTENGTLPAEVSVVEELGNENFLHLDVGGGDESMVARVNETVRPAIGDTVYATFASGIVYVFDETGETLKHRSVS